MLRKFEFDLKGEKYVRLASLKKPAEDEEISFLGRTSIQELQNREELTAPSPIYPLVQDYVFDLFVSLLRKDQAEFIELAKEIKSGHLFVSEKENSEQQTPEQKNLREEKLKKGQEIANSLANFEVFFGQIVQVDDWATIFSRDLLEKAAGTQIDGQRREKKIEKFRKFVIKRPDIAIKILLYRFKEIHFPNTELDFLQILEKLQQYYPFMFNRGPFGGKKYESASGKDLKAPATSYIRRIFNPDGTYRLILVRSETLISSDVNKKFITSYPGVSVTQPAVNTRFAQNSERQPKQESSDPTEEIFCVLKISDARLEVKNAREKEILGVLVKLMQINAEIAHLAEKAEEGKETDFCQQSIYTDKVMEYLQVLSQTNKLGTLSLIKQNRSEETVNQKFRVLMSLKAFSDLRKSALTDIVSEEDVIRKDKNTIILLKAAPKTIKDFFRQTLSLSHIKHYLSFLFIYQPDIFNSITAGSTQPEPIEREVNPKFSKLCEILQIKELGIEKVSGSDDLIIGLFRQRITSALKLLNSIDTITIEDIDALRAPVAYYITNITNDIINLKIESEIKGLKNKDTGINSLMTMAELVKAADCKEFLKEGLKAEQKLLEIFKKSVTEKDRKAIKDEVMQSKDAYLQYSIFEFIMAYVFLVYKNKKNIYNKICEKLEDSKQAKKKGFGTFPKPSDNKKKKK